MLKIFYTLLLGTIAPSLHSESDNPFVSGFIFMKKGAIPKDFTGQTFNRLTVLSFHGKTKSGNSVWKCKCTCGNTSNVIGSLLINGGTKSCGCLVGELSKIRNATHGYTRVGNHAPEYNAWESMKRRCYKTADNRYHRYGARGITVCERWLEGFENFIEDMGCKPTSEHSLDRIDNDKNYEPLNCRWATDPQQRRNKSTNRWIEYNGEKLILQDWVNNYGLIRSSFYFYKKIYNLSDSEALELCFKNNKINNDTTTT